MCVYEFVRWWKDCVSRPLVMSVTIQTSILLCQDLLSLSISYPSWLPGTSVIWLIFIHCPLSMIIISSPLPTFSYHSLSLDISLTSPTSSTVCHYLCVSQYRWSPLVLKNRLHSVLMLPQTRVTFLPGQKQILCRMFMAIDFHIREKTILNCKTGALSSLKYSRHVLFNIQNAYVLKLVYVVIFQYIWIKGRSILLIR